MESELQKSRMTRWTLVVTWICACHFSGVVWCIDICEDEWETGTTAEITHREFPDWTTQERCGCNITTQDELLYIRINLHLQFQTTSEEVCTAARSSHLLVGTRETHSSFVCPSDTGNVTITLPLPQSHTANITLSNANAQQLRFNVRLTAEGGNMTISCGAVAVAGLFPPPAPVEKRKDYGYTDGEIAAIAAGVVVGVVMLILIIGGTLNTKGKCKCLCPRTEKMYSDKENVDDALGDNPAYEPTPQSSAASSVANVTPDKTLQPNGKHITFTQPSVQSKRGILNRAFGIKPQGKDKDKKPKGNDLYYTDSSGKVENPRLSIERYDTPPENFDSSIFPQNRHPVNALPLGMDPNMNKVHEPTQRMSAPPRSQDRPLAVHFSSPNRRNIPNDAPDYAKSHLPSDAMKPPLDVGKPQQHTAAPTQPNIARPYVGHPDYPHYGNLAPAFNVSADSIIYMDRDELDDFFLRQNRKPQVGFQPDPSKDYTPSITKIYQPQTFRQDSHPPVPIPPPSSESFYPVLPDEPPRAPDRDLVSPVSSQYASPDESPVHRGAVSSITSTPSHASGYMTPPENLVELRRSSASPHLDNFSMGSRSFQTDV